MKKERQMRAEEESKSCTSTISSISAITSSEGSSSEVECDSPFKIPQQTPVKVHRRETRTGTAAFIPHDILKSPKVVSLATRMKISPAQQAAFTKAIIEESGGDTSKVSVSYATADRSRRTVNEEIAKSIQNSWIPPKFASIHWDSKLMLNQAKHTSEERLVVAVGDQRDVKILGVPAYQPGTDQRSGDIIASYNAVTAIMEMCRFNSEHDIRHHSQQYWSHQCRLYYPAEMHWTCSVVVSMPSSCRRGDSNTGL